jgi:hypothetical protein
MPLIEVPFAIGTVVRHVDDICLPLVVTGFEVYWSLETRVYVTRVQTVHKDLGVDTSDPAYLVEALVLSRREADDVRAVFPDARLPLVAM